MAVYPSTIYASYEHVVGQRFRTIISSFDAGNEQRRKKWTYPKHDVTYVYNALRSTAVDTLWNFYCARGGAYEAFYVFIGEAEGQKYNWTSQFVQSGSTSTSVNLPAKLITAGSATVYKNGTVLSTTTYSISATAGANNEDVLHLAFVPATSDVITIDYTGYPRIRCRFKEDGMSRNLFEKALYKTGIELYGLGPAT